MSHLTVSRSRAGGRHYAVSLHAAHEDVRIAAPKATFPTAVERNREKRRCRAILRDSAPPSGTTIRILRSTKGIKHTVLYAELNDLMQRLKRDGR